MYHANLRNGKPFCLSAGISIEFVEIPGHMYLVVLDQEGNPFISYGLYCYLETGQNFTFDKQIEMSREYFEYMLELSRAEYEEEFFLL